MWRTCGCTMRARSLTGSSSSRRARSGCAACSTRSSCACGGSTWPARSPHSLRARCNSSRSFSLRGRTTTSLPRARTCTPEDAQADESASRVKTRDVVIVGGGPAGSTAAWKLKRAGADVLVLDKERFPRLKLCAGWITPEVVRDLALDIKAYPHRFLTFDKLHIHVKGLHLPVRCVQHSISRVEFDAWLLERSGAPVVEHTVRSIREQDGTYIVDDAFRCRYLIGAGGTRCPVYRTL